MSLSYFKKKNHDKPIKYLCHVLCKNLLFTIETADTIML